MKRNVVYSRDKSTRTLEKKYNHGPVKGLSAYSGNWKFFSLVAGFLLIRPGYQWDGASGPTRDRWFCGRYNAVRGPLVHDALYEIIRLLLGPLTKENTKEYKRLRKVADVEFLKVLKEDKMPWWRRHLWYRVVRWFGWDYLVGPWKS